MYCPYCGKNLPDDAKYCGKCGRKIAQDKPIKRNSSRLPQNKWLWVLAGILVVLFVAAVGTAWNLFSQNDGNAAYERDTSLLSTEQTKLVMLDVSMLDIEIAGSDSALEALDTLSSVLGIESARDELILKNENTINGTTYYRFQQKYQEIPVYGKCVVLTANESGEPELLSGNTISLRGANTVPEIGEDEAVQSAIDYLISEELMDAETDADASTSLCFYETEDHDGPVLSYAVEIGLETVFVDAINATVLGEESGLDFEQVQLCGQGGELRPVNVTGEDDGVKSLIDEERNITVYTSAGLPATKNVSVLLPQSSLITYQGDDPKEPSAVDALYHIALAYDFYAELGHVSTDGNGESSILIYDHAAGWPNNAASGSKTEEKRTIIVVGPIVNKTDREYTYAQDIDFMAHEYTHAVIKYTCALNDGEAAALKEGISDIMGEMVEAWQNGSCNWIFSDARNLISPEKELSEPGMHYSTYSDYADTIDAHNTSTIISHAAYLMWAGSETESAVEPIDDVSDLSELWYRTILLLNSDATFMDCRTCCEAAAQQMMEQRRLSPRQYSCVLWAFDQADIPYASAAQGYDDGNGANIELNVYDAFDQAAADYTVTVKNLAGQRVQEETVGSTAKPVDLTLAAGIYQIEVSSPGYRNAYFSITISPRKYTPWNTVGNPFEQELQQKTNMFSIYTEFGTSLAGVVTDQDGQPLEGVQVTVNQVALVEQESNTHVITTTTNENGAYSIRIPVGIYQLVFEKDGYEAERTERQKVVRGNNRFAEVTLNSTKREWTTLDGDMLHVLLQQLNMMVAYYSDDYDSAAIDQDQLQRFACWAASDLYREEMLQKDSYLYGVPKSRVHEILQHYFGITGSLKNQENAWTYDNGAYWISEDQFTFEVFEQAEILSYEYSGDNHYQITFQTKPSDFLTANGYEDEFFAGVRQGTALVEIQSDDSGIYFEFLRYELNNTQTDETDEDTLGLDLANYLDHDFYSVSLPSEEAVDWENASYNDGSIFIGTYYSFYCFMDEIFEGYGDEFVSNKSKEIAEVSINGETQYNILGVHYGDSADTALEKLSRVGTKTDVDENYIAILGDYCFIFNSNPHVYIAISVDENHRVCAINMLYESVFYD